MRSWSGGQLIRVKLWMWILMNIVSWSDVQNRPVGLTCHKWQSNSFRKTGLTCHKWKADDLNDVDDPDEGVGKADDPDEGVGKFDDPDEGVGEVDDLDEVVDEANDPDEVVDEANDPDVALPGLHVCIYKEISCAPCLVLIKKTPRRKGFRKIRSWGFL